MSKEPLAAVPDDDITVGTAMMNNAGTVVVTAAVALYHHDRIHIHRARAGC